MKTKNKVGLIFCGAAFVIMVVCLLFVDGTDNLAASLGRIKIPFLILAAVLMLLYWFFEAATLHLSLKAVSSGQKFKNTFLITLAGQYFNCITPFASGGQPFQAYYLTKTGTTLAAGMTGLLARFIVYQFALTLWSAVLLLLRLTYFTTELLPLAMLTMVGFAVNLAVIIGLLMLAFFRKFSLKLARGIVGLLYKMHIIKDFEGRMEYIDKEMSQYARDFWFLKSKPKLIFELFGLSTLQLFAFFSISFVLYLGFGLSGADFLTIISCQAFVLMISSFVPLPGALGAAEGSYAAFFGAIFGGCTALSTFIWRILTFYLPIIVGMSASFVLSKSGGETENEGVIDAVGK